MGDNTDTRPSFGVEGEGSLPVGPGHDADARASFDAARIDFGHYAGQTIAELAERDPDYLRWLARHPSGARYRAEIERVLGPLSMIPGL
jgi:broad specificity phosphatase PhoE